LKISTNILAIDPSGSFEEGKGTTGWCLFNSITKQVVDIGEICAYRFTRSELYWAAHTDLIDRYHKQYGEDLTIVCEDYILYANKASSQINSRMETPKLIAILQNYAFMKQINFRLQLAALVAKRWSDEILEHKGYILKYGKRSYVLNHIDYKHNLSQHERDSIRHAVHYSYFGKDKKK